MESLKSQVQQYWDAHHLGTQFVEMGTATVGSKEYFLQLDEAMDRWEYKNRLINSISLEFKNGVLLEVGCGQGGDLVKFAKRGMKVYGIDLAPTVVDIASRHLQAYGLGGTVCQGDAENLTFAENMFDVVYSCGVLGHTVSIQRAVDNVYRVLRKGGLAVVILYYRYSWFNLLSIVGRANIEFEDKDPPIGNTYTKGMLREIFAAFDRLEIQLEYYYPIHTPRKGTQAALYNGLLIPALKMIPESVMRHFGWHVVVKARK